MTVPAEGSSAGAPDGLRARLRRLPALAGPLPDVDMADLPADPVAIFVRWFDEAVDAGVPEPHAMTVCTVGPGGRPSSRVVVLKDVVDGAWCFATDARSRKVCELGANPWVALSFYWPALGRQVRLEGRASRAAPEVSRVDFLSSSPASRAAALAARPGEPLDDLAELDVAARRAADAVSQEPGLVLDEWVVVSVVPETVEFWQGRPDRSHRRLVQTRSSDGWDARLVWP